MEIYGFSDLWGKAAAVMCDYIPEYFSLYWAEALYMVFFPVQMWEFSFRFMDLGDKFLKVYETHGDWLVFLLQN